MKKLKFNLSLIFLGAILTTTAWGRIVIGEEMTPQGKIEIWADINSRDELYKGNPIAYDVKMNDKLLFQQKDGYSIRFSWGKPLKQPSELVLLDLGSGEKVCESYYRLIDAKKSVPLYVSAQFGNCNGAIVHEEGEKVIFYFPPSYLNPEEAYCYTREKRLQKISVTAAMRKYPRPGIPANVDVVANTDVGTINGVWNPKALNKFSTALGLGQFLANTWIGEAQRSGTALNELAQKNKWLNSKGEIIQEKQNEVLELRADPNVAIMATAEFLKYNIEQLDALGLIPANATKDERVQHGYIAHHEGGMKGAKWFFFGPMDEEKTGRYIEARIGKDSREVKSYLRQIQQLIVLGYGITLKKMLIPTRID